MRLGSIYNPTKFHDDISTNKKVYKRLEDGRRSGVVGVSSTIFSYILQPWSRPLSDCCFDSGGVSFRVADLARSVISKSHSKDQTFSRAAS